MTLRAIIGLVVFNVLILGIGGGVLWGLRGWRWWTDFVRLAGVAYLIGLASLMILLTFELVVGVPINLATLAVSGLALFGSGLVLGVIQGHSYPSLRPPGWRLPRMSVFVALFVAGIVVYFEALFRAGRLGVIEAEWDAWAFWVPKAQAIYFFGKLDPEFLSSLPSVSPSYPPGLPVVHAAAFHAMGSADVATLYLQYWFYAAGFAAAVVGFLAHRLRAAILVPLTLLVLVMPSLVNRAVSVYADVPLGYLVAVAALLVVVWLEERQLWQLVGATTLLAGAMLTKREGLLFVGCVLVAAFAASWKGRSTVWLRLVGAGLAVVMLTLPWRVWFTAKGLPADAPDAGYLGAFGLLERVWPSLRLVAETLFNPEHWLVASALAAAAIVLGLLAGAWMRSVYAAVFMSCAIAAATWAIWANSSLLFTQADSANPIVRLLGTPVLVLAVLTPLLLDAAWTGPTGVLRPSSKAGTWSWEWLLRRSRAAWSIVLAAAVVYPASAFVGYSGQTLPGGFPRFPGTTDCVDAPVTGQRVRLVVGYADSYPEANALRTRALAAGLANTELGQDGCGRLRVFVDDLPSLAASRPLVAEATAANLEATVELDPDG
ncbi:MAG: hypothetical protein ACRDNY_00390 [Gaiellaceae bacterium]